MRLRTLAVAVVVAVGSTGALAASVGAAAGSSPQTDGHRPPAADASAPTISRSSRLGALSTGERPADATQPAAPLTQQLHLNVGGGALTLAHPIESVALHRTSGTSPDWVGVLPPVRVVDARGTLAGWTVEWKVNDVALQGISAHHVPDAKVHVEPATPVVVDGVADGLQRGRPGPAVRPGRTLFGAAPGSGGGTYEIGGTVSIRLPSNLTMDAVTVELSFSFSFE